MVNVTLSVDEEDLKRARVLALEQGTSLNAVIRDFIKDYIGRTKTLPPGNGASPSSRRTLALR